MLHLNFFEGLYLPHRLLATSYKCAVEGSCSDFGLLSLLLRESVTCQLGWVPRRTGIIGEGMPLDLRCQDRELAFGPWTFGCKCR